MPDINQNFSISQGSNLVVEYDIGPDDTGMNLAFCEVVARFWTLTLGVPDTDEPPVLVKDENTGLDVIDPLLLRVTLSFVVDDTLQLTPGNYFYKFQITDQDGAVKYPTYGIMTVLRSD